jgi:hypothetical protein
MERWRDGEMERWSGRGNASAGVLPQEVGGGLGVEKIRIGTGMQEQGWRDGCSVVCPGLTSWVEGS